MFDDARAVAFLLARHPGEVWQAFRLASHPAQRADVLRLAWLALEGGIYIDADDRCLGRLDAFVPPAPPSRAIRRPTPPSRTTCSAPRRARHPAITRALDLAVTAISRGDSDIVWLYDRPRPHHPRLRASFRPRFRAGFRSNFPRSRQRGYPRPDGCPGAWAGAAPRGHARAGTYKSTPQHWSNAAFRKAAQQHPD